MIFQKVIDIEDKLFTGKASHIDLLRIHPDRIYRAGFYAKAAKNAAEEIDIVDGRIFFDPGIRIFSRIDFDTFSGTSRRAEHTGRTTNGPIRPLHQAMFSTVPFGNRFYLLRVFVGRHLLESEEVLEQVSECRSQTPNHLEEIDLFPKSPGMAGNHFNLKVIGQHKISLLTG